VRSRRSVPIAVAAASVLAIAGAAVASAAAPVTPPAGTPDLTMMVVQPTDLAAGGKPPNAGYVSPFASFSAIYGADYDNATTTDGVTYFGIDDSIFYASTPTTASTFFSAEQGYFKSRKGRKQLTKEIIKSAGKKAHLKAKNVTFGSAGSAGVGTDSAIFTIRVATKRYKDNESILIFDEGTVYSSLVLTATPNEKIPSADLLGLATTSDTRIKAVVAGATGASGTTGASGATG
jgi:hypothetical protein